MKSQLAVREWVAVAMRHAATRTEAIEHRVASVEARQAQGAPDFYGVLAYFNLRRFRPPFFAYWSADNPAFPHTTADVGMDRRQGGGERGNSRQPRGNDLTAAPLVVNAARTSH
jgi:hypothetical protein